MLSGSSPESSLELSGALRSSPELSRGSPELPGALRSSLELFAALQGSITERGSDHKTGYGSGYSLL
eukprot:14864707-Alexandrium_andersonii.AAC.1